jgi:hypothetical protein
LTGFLQNGLERAKLFVRFAFRPLEIIALSREPVAQASAFEHPIPDLPHPSVELVQPLRGMRGSS